MADSDLFDRLCSYDNLESAFKKARRRKTLKPYVIEFDRNLRENILQLQQELLSQTYRPRPLQTFILRDPKTRTISKSDFRDRVIHHALCNIIEPIFEKQFIYDSYANRKGKGTLKAIQRFDHFKRKASKNGTRACLILKADIRHYFDEVDCTILLNLLRRRITDGRILYLIKTILENYRGTKNGRGMPLGNLTSQFFANIYLHELDRFVKHSIKVQYYIRYVDDFVIFGEDCNVLSKYQCEINNFLKQKLSLELHPDKCKVIKLSCGVNFLGFRIFYHHRLLRKVNLRKLWRNLVKFRELASSGDLSSEEISTFLAGWSGYALHAQTYRLRSKVRTMLYNLI
jgi:retron-type reverse transcriptase